MKHRSFLQTQSFNKKVKKAVSGLPKYVQKYFINDITRGKDKELAADFITSCMNQEPCKPSTRRFYTLAFAYLCRYLADKKIDVSLDQVTADTLYDYITNFRPAAAAEEEGEEEGETTTTTTMTTTPPTAKRAKSKAVEKEEEEETRLLQQQQEYESWKTTQKTLCNPLKKFYKWVAYPDMTVNQRKRLSREKWPDVLRRFELAEKTTGAPMTPIKDSDIWEERHCPFFEILHRQPQA